MFMDVTFTTLNFFVEQEKTYGSLKQKLQKLQAKMKPKKPAGPIEIPTFKNFAQLELFMKDGNSSFSCSIKIDITSKI